MFLIERDFIFRYWIIFWRHFFNWTIFLILFAEILFFVFCFFIYLWTWSTCLKGFVLCMTSLLMLLNSKGWHSLWKTINISFERESSLANEWVSWKSWLLNVICDLVRVPQNTPRREYPYKYQLKACQRQNPSRFLLQYIWIWSTFLIWMNYLHYS